MAAPKPQELADTKKSHGLHPGAGGGPRSLDFCIGGYYRESGPAQSSPTSILEDADCQRGNNS